MNLPTHTGTFLPSSFCYRYICLPRPLAVDPPNYLPLCPNTSLSTYRPIWLFICQPTHRHSTFLQTNLTSYSSSFLPPYPPAFLPSSLIYLPTYPATNIPSYSYIHPPTYSMALNSYQPTCLPYSTNFLPPPPAFIPCYQSAFLPILLLIYLPTFTPATSLPTHLLHLTTY